MRYTFARKPRNFFPKNPEKKAKRNISSAKKRKKLYWKKVWELTEKVKHLIPGIEKRGWKTYHIDHKVSIYKGWKNNIPPEIIAGIDNLQMLPYKENLKKGIK